MFVDKSVLLFQANSDLSSEVIPQEHTQGECVFNRKCVFKAERDESTAALSDRKRVGVK